MKYPKLGDYVEIPIGIHDQVVRGTVRQLLSAQFVIFSQCGSWTCLYSQPWKHVPKP